MTAVLVYTHAGTDSNAVSVAQNIADISCKAVLNTTSLQ